MAEPLANLPDIYGFSTLKGYFPHKFNKEENQNYIGKIPALKCFGHREMKPESYDDFVAWHAEQAHITDWNFQEELIKYCRADVEVLSQAVLAFRKLFIEKLDTDPYRYTTLASLCMNIYINKFLPSKTIMGNCNSNKDRIVCREWLNHLNTKI